MTPQELKNSILQLAIQGKLVEQRAEEGTAEELYRQIQQEKQKLIKEGKIKKEKPLPEIVEEEKPFDIPESWKWVRFGECGILKSGYAFKSNEYSSSGIQVVRISDLAENSISVQNAVYYTQWESLAPYLITKNSFLICLTGSIGKMAWIQDDVPRYLNQRVGMFQPLSCCNTSYLWWFLHNGIVINQWVEAKTSTNGNIKNSDVTDLVMPLPPLAEQKRIVAKIEELLPLIDRYEKAWSQLEEFNKRFPDDMQKSILQMAIQGKLVEQRPEEGTGEELYQQIQAEKQKLIKEGKIKKEKKLPEITEEEKPFDVPDSWKWVCIGSVCTNIQYGSSSKSSLSGKIPVLRMGNIQHGKIVYDKLVYTSDESEISKYQLQYNDLLFNRTNSKELVGKTAIYKAEKPAIFAGYLVRITPILIDSDYLNYVMQTQYYWNYCQTVRSDAIGQSNINAEKLKQFVFPLPPIVEQKRITNKLNELLTLCQKLNL